MARLSDLCNIISDTCDPAAAADTPYVGLEHIDSGSFLLERVGNARDVRSAKTRFRAGDVLYGKLRPYLDKAVVAERDGICSTDILVLRPIASVSVKYLLAVLHSRPLLEHAAQTTHGVNHPRTSWKALSSFEWNEPPQDIQRIVGGFAWQAQLTLKAHANAASEARSLKRAAMAQLFAQGVLGERQVETDIGFIPVTWNVCEIQSVMDLAAGGTPSRQHPEFWVGGTIPWVKTSEVNYRVVRETEERITPAGLANSSAKLCPPRTLLLAMYGQGVTRGRVAMLGIEAATNQACLALQPRGSPMNVDFLYYYLTHSYERLRSLGHGAQQANLSSTAVASFRVPMPSTEEQHAIVDVLRAIDNKVDVHERKRTTLQELFDALLPDLATGRIRTMSHHGSSALQAS